MKIGDVVLGDYTGFKRIGIVTKIHDSPARPTVTVAIPSHSSTQNVCWSDYWFYEHELTLAGFNCSVGDSYQIRQGDRHLFPLSTVLGPRYER